MYCRICGDENGAEYRPAKLQTLCGSCNRITPPKVPRSSFERRYWQGSDMPPDAIRREFYEDYLRSGHTLRGYCEATTEPCHE